jgi:hypothetical protein
MGLHLGVWGFIPSQSLTLPGAWNVTPRLHSWPTSLQALALVMSLRLGLWQLTYSSSLYFVRFLDEARYVHGPTNPQSSSMDGCCPWPQSTFRLGRLAKMWCFEETITYVSYSEKTSWLNNLIAFFRLILSNPKGFWSWTSCMWCLFVLQW